MKARFPDGSRKRAYKIGQILFFYVRIYFFSSESNV